MPERSDPHQLLEALLLTDEKEREKIAKKIHGEIGGALSTLKLNLARALRHADKKEMLEEITKENFELIDEAMRSMRHAQRELRHPLLNKTGFFSALNDLCETLSAKSGVQISVQAQSSSTGLGAGEEIQLYRILKQLLHELAEVAQAKKIVIEKMEDGRGLNIVHDAGSDLAQDAATRMSIEARAKVSGMQIEYGSPIKIAFAK